MFMARKELLIVERPMKDIVSERGQLVFTQDYFNTAILKRTHYYVNAGP
jgi:hypothetical protein